MLLLDILKIINNQNTKEKQGILKIADRRFKNLLEYVLNYNKFYKRYYGKEGINLSNFHSINLKDLPPIDKNIVNENFDELVCDPNLKYSELERFVNDPVNISKKYKNYTVLNTSGSTGTIGIFVYSKDELNISKGLSVSRVVKTNLLKKHNLFFIGATKGNFAGIKLIQDVPNLLYNKCAININSPIDEILTSVEKHNPDILCGYASGIYLLAQHQLKKDINIKPHTISTSADPLTPIMKDTILKAFGVQPINFYASSEFLSMGVGCKDCDGIHLFDDYYKFEILDENNCDVKDEQQGQLVVTSLYKKIQPLIRYKMNDRFSYLNNKCTCGLPFTLVSNIAGRQEELLWFDKPNGKKEFIHPIPVVGFFVPGLERFQIFQTSYTSFTMRVVINGNTGKIISDIKDKMDNILSERDLAGCVNYQIDIVEEIKQDKRTGKFKLIIPYKNSIPAS